MPIGPARVAVVMDHPAQQFTRALQLFSREPGLRVQVCYWSVAGQVYDSEFDRALRWDVDLLGGYLWASPAFGCSSAGRLRWLIGQLRSTRPQVVICYGWAAPIARASILYCLLTGTRLVLYGDTTWQHSSRRRYRLVRGVALRVLMRRCAGAVSTGAFNREFYIRCGMDPRQIWPGVCPADTELFAAAPPVAARPVAARPGAAAASAWDDASLRIGFAGKLIARKGVDELIRASALLPRDRDWSVTIIGDGPLRPQLQALAAELGLTDRVTFHGFANTTEMPKLLAGFDVVVVPSRLDMRVLVTIEAMAAGAALVVSDATAVWGPGDLVEDEVTGLVYRSGDHAALAARLRRLLDDPGLAASLRLAGTRRSASFGPDMFARTMASAVRRCL